MPELRRHYAGNVAGQGGAGKGILNEALSVHEPSRPVQVRKAFRKNHACHPLSDRFEVNSQIAHFTSFLLPRNARSGFEGQQYISLTTCDTLQLEAVGV
jgi:hypothetical protein